MTAAAAKTSSQKSQGNSTSRWKRLGADADEAVAMTLELPADADLRAIPTMPIDVAKVIALAKTMPAEAFRAAMILRCTAWHQVPSGTLPDDDTALAAM